MDDKTEDNIEMLSEKQAQFALKSLLIAGHVSQHTLEQVVNMAKTITMDM